MFRIFAGFECVRATNSLTVVGWFFATAVTMLWLVFPNWLTLDIAAVALSVGALIVLRKTIFEEALIFSAGIVVYDVINIFGTKMMQRAAEGMMGLPNIIYIPSLYAFPAKISLIVGVGDVVLPGLTVIIAARLARRFGKPLLGLAAIIGYEIGFAISLAVLYATRFPQPATLYLIPTTLLCFALAAKLLGVDRAKIKGEFSAA